MLVSIGAEAAPAVQLGDSLITIKAKLGDPRSIVEAGDQMILVYPAGQILLKNGQATSIEMGWTPAPPPSATTAAPATTTPPPAPSAEPEEDHPPDVRFTERKDAEGVVTILAESDTNLEFTVTVDFTLNNMTASRPLPLTVDSAGQKTVEVVQLRRANPTQAWSYKYNNTNFRRGARRESQTNDAFYLIPFTPGETHRVVQGNLGKFSHYAGSGNEHATDFACDPGTIVRAARDGVVTGIRQDFTLGGTDEKFKSMGNYVIIKHADGTFAEYFHLLHHGVLVQLGQSVSAGQAIAKSGATGYATGPHLHFAVFQNIDGKDRLTLPVLFQTSHGVLDALTEGESY
jgi:murein DD-endopeptidase MepM/ murein hydrolase activator NlpD